MRCEILGYHLAGSQSGLNTIKKHHQCIAKVIPTWIEVKADGGLLLKNIASDKNIIEKYYNKADIIPLVQNYKLKSSVSNELINNEANYRKTINRIIAYLYENRYCEVNLDLEGVKYNYKEKFTEFVAKISEKIHDHGFKLSLSIPAKVENNSDSTWSGAYDYFALGQLVDRIIIMAYDFHWAGGPPGPIAPLNWVQDVIDYALVEIPAEKIFPGYGLYGYDWEMNSGRKAEGIVYSMLKQHNNKYNIEVQWDQDSGSPYFIYEKDGIKHEVYFENKKSIELKLNLLKEFQLSGASLWRLGQEDSRIWNIIK